eukprot:GHVL01010442.1.p1 GENE.GHVL01010442.1~~GHVL01010442.1.p1  ORF type:complete len:184 (+),score=30.31 GHVL01010442.1:86-637(+)
MGVILSKFWTLLFTQKNHKILILGLNNAGKTTILYKLHLGQAVPTQPTIGSNVEEVSWRNIRFQAWDLGGGEKYRSYWKSYFANTNAVIFVVDSCDPENLTLSKMELFNILVAEDMKGVPVLIFANKQDVSGAMDAGEISIGLNLTSIKDRDWHIQSCCAVDGTGIDSGIQWMASRVVEGIKK